MNQMLTTYIHCYRYEEKDLLPPGFNFLALKNHVMEALEDGTCRVVMNCRDLIGGNNLNHFEPLLKLFDQLLLIGLTTDEDIRQFMMLIYPADFDATYRPNTTQKGLIEVELAEAAKLQLCSILSHLCDIQLRHRVESFVSFAEGFVGEAQSDQFRRYTEIKQSDLPANETARKTKEFRCPPREQMLHLLNFRNAANAVLDEEGKN